MNILDSYGLQVNVRGYNAALATSNELISATSTAWSDSGTTSRNFHAGVGTTLALVSAAAADAAAGANARTVKVVGALGTTGEIASETIALNGTTPVTSVKKYQLIYAMQVMTFGDNKSNAGAISAMFTGVTNAALIMPLGSNVVTGACFMIPPGKAYKTKSLTLGASTQPVVVSVKVYDANTGGWNEVAYIPMGNVGLATFDIGDILTLEAGDVVRLDALSTTAAGRVFANLILERV